MAEKKTKLNNSIESKTSRKHFYTHLVLDCFMSEKKKFLSEKEKKKFPSNISFPSFCLQDLAVFSSCEYQKCPAVFGSCEY